jgi:REP element-mobilizing transposase RayT
MTERARYVLLKHPWRVDPVPYWRLHYHFVWTTFERTPGLNDHLCPLVYRSVSARAKRLGVIVHQLGGTEDHVHVVASVPPKLAVAECVGRLKGASSHTANDALRKVSTFRWESGYSALSLGDRSLPGVIAYVRNQRAHRAGGSLIALYEHAGEDVATLRAQSERSDRERPVDGAPNFSGTIHRPGSLRRHQD